MKLTEGIHLIGSGCFGLTAAGDCNVYALVCRGQMLLIDCGISPDPEPLFDNLLRDGLAPKAIAGILLTHTHTDHASAVSAFNDLGVPVYGSAAAGKILKDGVEAFYGTPKGIDPAFWAYLCRLPKGRVDRFLEDGQTIALGDISVKALATPGHSPDSVCYLARIGTEYHLFSGDTLFYPGHINYFPAPLSQTAAYPEALRRLHATHPTGLYPGHGLFTIRRGEIPLQRATAAIKAGGLPPMKPYS